MTQEYEYAGKAMGTEFAIAIVAATAEEAHVAAGIAKALIAEYESRFSRFLPDSELSMLNGKKDMVVSPTFLAVLGESLALAEETKGVFNPLFQIGRLGYDKDFALVTDHEEDAGPGEPYDVDFTSITVDPAASRIRLSPGQKLDFGGFLKGRVAETAAREILKSSKGIRGAVVNLGGDVYTLGTDVDGLPFTFSIFNPITGTEDTSVSVADAALATSGTYKRHWKRGGKDVHHVLAKDGRGNPGTGVVSASVIHEDGGKAEAYAKVLLSLGPVDAKPFLEAARARYLAIMEDGTAIRKNI